MIDTIVIFLIIVVEGLFIGWLANKVFEKTSDRITILIILVGIVGMAVSISTYNTWGDLPQTEVSAIENNTHPKVSTIEKQTLSKYRSCKEDYLGLPESILKIKCSKQLIAKRLALKERK